MFVGVAVLRFFNEVFDESTTNPAVFKSNSESQNAMSSGVTRLQFNLDGSLLDAIRYSLLVPVSF